jgi:hypothetical protein
MQPPADSVSPLSVHRVIRNNLISFVTRFTF